MTDHAGTGDEHRFRREPDLLGRELCHTARILQAALARAGVGIAAVHDDRAAFASRETLAVHIDGGGVQLAAGKHSRRGGRVVGEEDAEVELVLAVGLDACVGSART